MVLDDPEELFCVWGADGLPFVEDGGVPVEEGRVADVLVANYPSQI